MPSRWPDSTNTGPYREACRQWLIADACARRGPRESFVLRQALAFAVRFGSCTRVLHRSCSRHPGCSSQTADLWPAGWAFDRASNSASLGLPAMPIDPPAQPWFSSRTLAMPNAAATSAARRRVPLPLRTHDLARATERVPLVRCFTRRQAGRISIRRVRSHGSESGTKTEREEKRRAGRGGCGGAAAE